MQISIFHFSLRSWIDKIGKYIPTYSILENLSKCILTEFSVSQIKLFRIAEENGFPKRYMWEHWLEFTTHINVYYVLTIRVCTNSLSTALHSFHKFSKLSSHKNKNCV